MKQIGQWLYLVQTLRGQTTVVVFDSLQPVGKGDPDAKFGYRKVADFTVTEEAGIEEAIRRWEEGKGIVVEPNYTESEVTDILKKKGYISDEKTTFSTLPDAVVAVKP